MYTAVRYVKYSRSTMPKENDSVEQLISEFEAQLHKAETQLQANAFNHYFKKVNQRDTEKDLVTLASIVEKHWAILGKLWLQDKIEADDALPALLRLGLVNKALAEKTLDYMLSQLPQEILAYIYAHFHTEQSFNTLVLPNNEINISELEYAPKEASEYQQYTAYCYFLCSAHAELQKNINAKIATQLAQAKTNITSSLLTTILDTGKTSLYDAFDLSLSPIYDRIELSQDPKTRISLSILNHRQTKAGQELTASNAGICEALIESSDQILIDYLAYRLLLQLPDKLAISTITANKKQLPSHEHIIGQFLLQHAQQSNQSLEVLKTTVNDKLRHNAQLRKNIRLYLPRVIGVHIKRLTHDAAEWLHFILKGKFQNQQNKWPGLAFKSQPENTSTHPKVVTTIKSLLWIAAASEEAFNHIIETLPQKLDTIPQNTALFNRLFYSFPYLNLGETILGVLHHEPLSQAIADQLFSRIKKEQHSKIGELLKGKNWDLYNLISDLEEVDETSCSCTNVIGLVCLALRWPSVRQRVIGYMSENPPSIENLPLITKFSMADFSLTNDWVPCFAQALSQHKNTLIGYSESFEKFKLAYAMALPEIYLPIAKNIGEDICKAEGREIKAQAWLMAGLQAGCFQATHFPQGHYVPKNPKLTSLLCTAISMSLLPLPNIRLAIFSGLGGQENTSLPKLTYININQWTLSNFDVSAIIFGLNERVEKIGTLSMLEALPLENVQRLKANLNGRVTFSLSSMHQTVLQQRPPLLAYSFGQVGEISTYNSPPRTTPSLTKKLN